MMSIWRLLLLLPMTTTKTQLPSYPRPRGSQHRPSGRPRRRRRRPRHHHPRRHRHHFFLSKSSPRIISLFSLSLSLDAVDKIAGKRRERERERESPRFGRLRASRDRRARLWAKRERETRAPLLPLLLLFLFFMCTRCPEEGKFGGVREEGSLREETTLFWCKSSLSRLSTPSLFSKPQKRQKRREKEKTYKQHRSLGSFFCVFRV